jgi:DNA mismatch endonuclease (patch repair protein)
MADVHTREQRSKNMAAIRGRGNKSTELRLVSLFKENKITGWRRHPADIAGRPDFIFRKPKVAVFIDGCFWHGCRCSVSPKSNAEFWNNKISANKKRDRLVTKALKEEGWRVVRIWEHDLKKSGAKVLSKIPL